MKIDFTIKASVTYAGTVTMTKAEFQSWCQDIDNARGFERDRLAHDLLDKAGIDESDPSWSNDDFQIDDFAQARPKPKRVAPTKAQS